MRLRDAQPPRNWFEKLVWDVGRKANEISFKQPFKWLLARPAITALLLMAVITAVVFFVDLKGYDTEQFLASWAEWEQVECADSATVAQHNYELQSYKVRGFVGDEVSYHEPPECL